MLIYRCDLCNTEESPNDFTGIDVEDEPCQITIGPSLVGHTRNQADKHVCLACVKKLWEHYERWYGAGDAWQEYLNVCRGFGNDSEQVKTFVEDHSDNDRFLELVERDKARGGPVCGRR
jgi:hypothetical protein